MGKPSRKHAQPCAIPDFVQERATPASAAAPDHSGTGAIVPLGAIAQADDFGQDMTARMIAEALVHPVRHPWRPSRKAEDYVWACSSVG